MRRCTTDLKCSLTIHKEKTKDGSFLNILMVVVYVIQNSSYLHKQFFSVKINSITKLVGKYNNTYNIYI